MELTSHSDCIEMLHSLGCLVFFSIVSIGTTQVNTCGSVTVLLSDLKFTLYTSQYQLNGIPLNEDTYSSVNTNGLTTIIIHGWLQNGTTPWILLMKDTYLNKTSDANIIIIDWSVYAGIDYFQDTCAVPYVGILIGDLIYNLTKVGVDVEKLQMNGFSLGAHVSGAAGQRVFDLVKSKVSRINGLDAAGPKYLNKPINERLDASDAVFVQAIHTNNNALGLGLNYGTIDFHVNTIMQTCGTWQPGCPLDPGVPTGGSPLPEAFCPHVRAAAYYIESINSIRFMSVQCSSCFSFSTDACSSNPKTIMGEMCPTDQSGIRYLSTNSTSPFALG